MKKLSLWICPVALVALGTSARAGTYLSLPPNNGDLATFYEGSTAVGAVTAAAPKLNPGDPNNPLQSDSQSNPAKDSGLSQKTWVWKPSNTLNPEPAPSEPMRCTYRIACNVYGRATQPCYSASGNANFTISGGVNKNLYYYMTDTYRGTMSNLLPPTTEGQPNTETTQYSDNGYGQAQPYSSANDTRIRVQASVSVANSASVEGAYPPGSGYASSGQASIQITDFSCPDQDPGAPAP